MPVFRRVQHTDSIRFYGDRMTLAAHGFAPQIVVEDSEAQPFRQRCAGERYGRLDWRESAQLIGSTRVRVFDPHRRE